MLNHQSRALTGAWIETDHLGQGKHEKLGSRALTGAWIETVMSSPIRLSARSRALTGAWIETGEVIFSGEIEWSRPHGRVD